MPRNPFAVLGVPLDATADAIKAAWRRLARENHPDVTSGDGGSRRRANRAMAEINAAYQELRDPEKRRIHRAAAARQARASAGWRVAGSGTHADTDHDGHGDGSVDGEAPARPPGASRPTPPVTARIDTSALFRPRNTVLHPTDRSPLPGLRPRPRSSEVREPPRASTPSGPTVVRPGPSFETELPRLMEALDTELRFGKFAGLTLGDVAEIEPTYIDWIVRTIDRDPELLFAARVVLRELERAEVLVRPRSYTANSQG
jgi:curved DNA-binding protein CbpA